MRFHLRLVERLRGGTRAELVVVSAELVAVQVHQEDVELFLAGLAALFVVSRSG